MLKPKNIGMTYKTEVGRVKENKTNVNWNKLIKSK